jgi:ribosomal protein S18 acetylase RimI-like enzyme
VLAGRGYVLDAPTDVRVAPIVAGDFQGVDDTPSQEWFAVVQAGSDRLPAQMDLYRRILSTIDLPTGYAVRFADGRPAAIGRGTVDGAWLDIGSMATLPSFRRRGLASSILRTLMAWGASRGATRASLGVETGNHAAVALNEGLGFTEIAYRYAYRIRPSD